MGTFGVLIKSEIWEPIALTLERPWQDNKPDISCIPIGTYICKQKNSIHFGNTFEVTGVKDRSDILFHSGNIATDSKGCIIVAGEYTKIGDIPGVGMSQYALKKFLDYFVDDKEFQLTIVET